MKVSEKHTGQALVALVSSAVAVLAAAAGLWAGVALTEDAYQPVSCPEEDSCTVDYRDGVWHIDPTVP